jgi:hypothetical protein
MVRRKHISDYNLTFKKIIQHIARGEPIPLYFYFPKLVKILRN